MGNNSAVFMVLFFMLVMIGSIFFAFWTQEPAPPPTKVTITCKNEDVTDKRVVGVLVDKEAKSMIISGEVVNPDHIRIFNDTAIEAAWMVKDMKTNVFLDRIAGRLVIQTSRAGSALLKEDFFNCIAAGIKF